MSTLVSQAHNKFNLLFINNSHIFLNLFLFTAKLSSLKYIPLAPKECAYSISSKTLSGDINVIFRPHISLTPQNEQLKGHPLEVFNEKTGVTLRNAKSHI